MTFKTLTIGAALALAATNASAQTTNAWLSAGTSYDQAQDRVPYRMDGASRMTTVIATASSAAK